MVAINFTIFDGYKNAVKFYQINIDFVFMILLIKFVHIKTVD